MRLNTGQKTFSDLKWMWIFLGVILFLTISGLIAYQYMRKDPVTVLIKNAQGFVTTQVVHKHPNETVGQVVQRVSQVPVDNESYLCDYDMNQKISDISNLTLTEMINGTISVDGQVIPYTSGAETVEEVLSENNITISPIDTVTPCREMIITSDQKDITVNRVNSTTESKAEVLPYHTETVENDNAPYNQVVTLQAGANGVRTYTEEVVYSNGVEVERHITSDQKQDPVNEVLEIGTNLTVGKPNIEKGDIASWRPYVIKALEENGLEPTEDRISRVLRQIDTESAGDQNAHQEIVDFNTLIGEDARGLMQTIPSTFEYYHHEGYDDILNGYHNLLAAIAYAKERYGPSLSGMGNGHGY